MKEQVLHDELRELASLPGVSACAMVEASSGLVWYAAGDSAVEAPLWEAAIEYWRLHTRISTHFSELGQLHAAVMYHTRSVLAIIPCQAPSDMLVVCIASHEGMNWRQWQQRVRAMSERLKEL